LKRLQVLKFDQLEGSTCSLFLIQFPFTTMTIPRHFSLIDLGNFILLLNWIHSNQSFTLHILIGKTQ